MGHLSDALIGFLATGAIGGTRSQIFIMGYPSHVLLPENSDHFSRLRHKVIFIKVNTADQVFLKDQKSLKGLMTKTPLLKAHTVSEYSI